MSQGAAPVPPSWSDALRAARLRLSASASETPDLDAEVLLRHVLGVDRTAFFLGRASSLTPEQQDRYGALVRERAMGVPVAYLTGTREFMGLPFAAKPGALIPRPETEILVEWALAWLRRRGAATVVDIGTGSGAIALSLAALLRPAWPGNILAIDISPAALAVARENRAALHLEQRVELVSGSLLAWRAEPVDLILANLPYLRPAQIRDNPQLAAEPALALDGGEDGLDLIRVLLQDAPRLLAGGGAIGLEIDPSQAEAVSELGQAAFADGCVTVLSDLAGLARHVILQRREGPPAD